MSKMTFRLGRAICLLSAFALCTVAAGFAAENAPSVEPAEALQKLLDGNQRFVEGNVSRPVDSVERRAGLAKGQHPFAVILGCSDSRTSPEIIFDQGLGELFVIRLAGNVADPVAIDSIDYAVKHLGSRLVVVLGHSACGAVTAAVKSAPHHHLIPMLKELQPAVAASRGQPGDPVENAIVANAKLTAAKLRETRELKAMVASGELEIVAARYDLASGQVELLSE